MSAIVFHDMELADEDKMDFAVPSIAMPGKKDLPEYPWGLRLSLDDGTIKKLDIDFASLAVGGIVHGHFMAKVTSTSEDQRDGGEMCRRVELQIQQMAVESEDRENKEVEASASRRRSRVLYDKAG